QHLVRAASRLRSLSVHPPEPAALLSGGGAGSDHHDEPEPAGSEGPRPRGERLPDQSQGRARDPPSALETRSAADPAVGAAARDPADPGGADRGAGSAALPGGAA